eukprot:gene42870-63666_t
MSMTFVAMWLLTGILLTTLGIVFASRRLPLASHTTHSVGVAPLAWAEALAQPCCLFVVLCDWGAGSTHTVVWGVWGAGQEGTGEVWAARPPLGASSLPRLIIVRLVPFLFDFWYTRGF